MPVIRSLGYNITIGKDALKKLSAFLKSAKYSSHVIICDENTLQFCLPTLIMACPALNEAEIIELESGEESKSLDFSAHIWQTLIENKADKNSLIINLGGGVVSDLGGFCASTYKRGIDFINIPTSLLAMADASIGGKTGIDFAGLKNSIGTFTQPKAVFVYPEYLKTLPQRHYKNGLAEIFKIALISDKVFWNGLRTLKPDHNAEQLLTKSITLKNKIVLKDPFDKGARKILNFGHTIGHAIEALLLGTLNELLHGEAIVIGMLVETHIAWQKKLITQKELEDINSTFKKVFEPAKIELATTPILELLKNDKKTSKNKFRFALVNKAGAGKIDVEVNETHIKKAFDYYNTSN
ncbi:MAG: 3-dehydroquinate synthase [Bacteroidetes bacterium]|nr:3-dehydroquinate synthase [Bacteroidota bacterium]